MFKQSLDPLGREICRKVEEKINVLHTGEANDYTTHLSGLAGWILIWIQQRTILSSTAAAFAVDLASSPPFRLCSPGRGSTKHRLRQ